MSAKANEGHKPHTRGHKTTYQSKKIKSKRYNLPIRKSLKSTALSRIINNDNESAETTWSGNEFQTDTMRTAKKCCLQLTLDSGKNSLKV